MDPVVIVGAARTPMGGFLGDFQHVSAPQLGARAIAAALERAGLTGDDTKRSDGLRAARRPGSGPGAAGFARRGRAQALAPRPSTRCAAPA